MAGCPDWAATKGTPIMDEQRFDDLTRTLVTGSASRRRVLRGLLATGGAGVASLVGLNGRFGVDTAEAGHHQTCKKAQPTDFMSKQACVQLPCGPSDKECVCAQTLGHRPFCVQGFKVEERSKDCPTKNECGGRRPCPNDFVCAKTTACCPGNNYRKCLRECRH